MSQNTTNTTAFIESQQYSKFILDNLPSLMLPEGMWRDVSDFGEGTTLNIKTVGTVTVQDVAEDVPLVFNPIDTGTITLSITDYVGDAWKVTDELREDGSQIDTLMAMRAMEATKAIAQVHESKFLAIGNTALQASTGTTGVAAVNGRPHRWIAGGDGVTTRKMSMSDFIAMRLAFDKADAPEAGRIAIVDANVEATLNSITNLVSVSNNPMFEGIVTEGFAKNHRFVRNIYGWDVYVSNRLANVGGAYAINASSYGLANTTTNAADKANVFMCIADDTCKPIMHAWRRQPSTEGWRESSERADKFQVTSRYGFGAQRLDTIGVVYTSSTTY